LTFSVSSTFQPEHLSHTCCLTVCSQPHLRVLPLF
jgi:hypothetical protein